MSSSARRSSESPDKAKLFVDVGTVVTVTSSANSYIDVITTEISKKIGQELEAANAAKTTKNSQ